jgi:hypothetical protein
MSFAGHAGRRQEKVIARAKVRRNNWHTDQVCGSLKNLPQATHGTNILKRNRRISSNAAPTYLKQTVIACSVPILISVVIFVFVGKRANFRKAEFQRLFNIHRARQCNLILEQAVTAEREIEIVGLAWIGLWRELKNVCDGGA